MWSIQLTIHYLKYWGWIKRLCKTFSQFTLEIKFFCLFPAFENAKVDIFESISLVFQKVSGKEIQKYLSAPTVFLCPSTYIMNVHLSCICHLVF